MSEAIVVALVTAGVSLIGTVITVVLSNKNTLSAMSEQSKLADESIRGEISVIKTEIKTLSDRVDKHNNLVERTYNLESKVKVLEAVEEAKAK